MLTTITPRTEYQLALAVVGAIVLPADPSAVSLANHHRRSQQLSPFLVAVGDPGRNEAPASSAEALCLFSSRVTQASDEVAPNHSGLFDQPINAVFAKSFF